jgi:hypothetical protein
MALVLISASALPAAAQDAPAARTAADETGGSGRVLATPASVRPQEEKLLALLDTLARQIGEINANLARLGPNNAAASRFRTVSLAAYQRAWAELTRNETELGGGSSQDIAAAAGAPR